MIIKNVKCTYAIKKYHVGPYIDFMAELEVPSLEYDSIVKAIQEAHPRYELIQLMSYSRK